MDSTLIAHIQNLAAGKKDFPQVRTGMQVEVSQRIKEGDKSRIQKFEGVVIKTGGKTHGEKTFTVRRVTNGLGVEKTFPISCPTLEGVEVIRQYKVKRKNIRFIRELQGKSARLKEVKVSKDAPKKVTKTPAKKEAPAEAVADTPAE
jgi:large subunit ribosomal protein L19